MANIRTYQGIQTPDGELSAGGGGGGTDDLPMKFLYQPISEVPYATAWGVSITDALSTSALSYTNAITHYWNETGLFNKQGQNWQFDTPGDATKGCRNRITLRTITGTAYGAVNDFEFTIMGDKLGIAFFPHGSSYDHQVYIKRLGETTLHRLAATPLGGVGGSTTLAHRNITLPDKGPWQIRFVGSNVRFVGIECEQSAIILPSAPRPMMIIDGDSWVERLDNYIGGSDESYYSYGMCEAIMEATGFVICRMGQGGSGYFQPGTGATQTDYTYMTQYGSSIFFSNDRKGIGGATTGQTGRPDPAGTWGWNMFVQDDWTVMGVVHGTQNDGSHSGATGDNSGPMSLRVQECMAWVYDQNPRVKMIQIGPEAHDNFTAGSVHDLNRQEQIHAMNAAPNAALLNSDNNILRGMSRGMIDPADPTARWLSGTGSNNSPTSDQQAQLEGGDGLHNSYKGWRWWGHMYARAMGEYMVNSDAAYARS